MTVGPKKGFELVSQGHGHSLRGEVCSTSVHTTSACGGNSFVELRHRDLEVPPRALHSKGALMPLGASFHLSFFTVERILGMPFFLCDTTARLWHSLAAGRDERKWKDEPKNPILGVSSGLNYCITLSQSPPHSENVSSSVTWRGQGSCCSDVPSSVSLQTTIMAVEFDGGVVVGSDSRVSAGWVPVPVCTFGRKLMAPSAHFS